MAIEAPAERDAQGWPGIEPRWTSSAKCGVGKALSHASNVWFTLSHGIVNEVFYPRIDQAAIRDFGLVVTADGLFSEEKRHAHSTVGLAEEGVPAYRLTNACERDAYRIEKEVCTDPDRPVLLQRIGFTPATAQGANFRLHALLAPHLDNHGAGNTGWLADYKGIPMLFAARGDHALALACSVPWRRRSVGFVGRSDGWQDLAAHGVLTSRATRACNGNIALTGEIDWQGGAGCIVLALAFGRSAAEAANHARAALQRPFRATWDEYVGAWRDWQRSLLPLDGPRHPARPNLYRTSTLVLRAHEATDFRGGIIASLSVPWGASKGDADLGGYHLVWPRDLAECAGALLAAGAHAEARSALDYLRAAQEADGHWAQNMWLDGTPYWNGLQLDETALPILLVALARREGALGAREALRYWPMVRRAAAWILRNGPASPQDRWEERRGYSPFTIGAQVAALLAAAVLADACQEHAIAMHLRETADAWHGSIDRWLYVTGTDWCTRYSVDGYYVRVTEPGVSGAHVVSPDALALVRFGLRAADDPRIVDTLRVIDATLRVETPCGPCWRRYNGDVYGEYADGSPYDGGGVGRAWPLLAAERAHFELAAGRIAQARVLAGACERFANEGGLIPEQVWDAADIPARELHAGRPSGSAMPLAWAHAEYVKLCRSLHEGRVFDLPPETVQRYLAPGAGASRAVWRFGDRIATMGVGTALRIETFAAAVVHWSADDWRTVHDTASRDTGLGVHVADLPTAGLRAGACVRFTFRWPGADCWEGHDFDVQVRCA